MDVGAMKRLRKTLSTGVLLVILVEVILIFSGVLDLSSAVRTIVVIEVSLLVFVVLEIFVVTRAVRSARASGAELPFALDRSLSEFFPAVVTRSLRQDLLLLRALGMLITGRRDVKKDEQALPYSNPIVPMLAVITVVDVLVAFGLHMLLPAGWIRTAILILGILGLIWLVGFIASLIVYPHVVSEKQLRLRFGIFHDIVIPREAIAEAESFRGDPGSAHAAACQEGRLIMVVANQATIRLSTRGVEELTALSPKLAGQPISEIIFYTDETDSASQVLSPPSQQVNP